LNWTEKTIFGLTLIYCKQTTQVDMLRCSLKIILFQWRYTLKIMNKRELKNIDLENPGNSMSYSISRVVRRAAQFIYCTFCMTWTVLNTSIASMSLPGRSKPIVSGDIDFLLMFINRTVRLLEISCSLSHSVNWHLSFFFNIVLINHFTIINTLCLIEGVMVDYHTQKIDITRHDRLRSSRKWHGCNACISLYNIL
jgi:hypothetical protein